MLLWVSCSSSGTGRRALAEPGDSDHVSEIHAQTVPLRNASLTTRSRGDGAHERNNAVRVRVCQWLGLAGRLFAWNHLQYSGPI